MKNACLNCAHLKKGYENTPCKVCWKYSHWQWRHLKALLLLSCMAGVIVALVIAALYSPVAFGDVLGVPIEIPEPYEGGC